MKRRKNMWYRYAIKHVKKIHVHYPRHHRKHRLHTNPFADEAGQDLQTNDSPLELNENVPQMINNPMPVQPVPQKILPPEEPTYVNRPTPPQMPVPDQTQNPVQNIPDDANPNNIDPDVENSDTLEPLKIEKTKPVNPNMPQPPIHENCHCEIVTMPGGNQIWKAGSKPCVDCANARNVFNSQQSQASNI